MPMNANDVMYPLATAVLQLKDTLHHWHSLACETYCSGQLQCHIILPDITVLEC